VSIFRRRYRPFARSGRWPVIAIFITFVLVTAVTLTLSINATDRARHRASIVELVARQRTLAERYLSEVLLVRVGQQASPATTASIMASSVQALLHGGTAPEVKGDDDSYVESPISGAWVRRQLVAEGRLVQDLSAYGSALLDGRPLSSVRQTGGENVTVADPLQHLRVLTSLTSEVALDASRSIAASADRDIANLRRGQIALQIGGLLLSLLLAGGLLATTRRQSAHFRTMVTSSSDLVWVLGAGGCRYASRSLSRMLGLPEAELLGGGLREYIHPDDLPSFDAARSSADPGTVMLRVRNSAGEWRQLEAHLTDLRGDRRLRGIMLSARDVTERIRLEQELAAQGQRDTFGSELTEALEMVDEEHGAYDVIERAMVAVSPDAPSELLLADSSRAHLHRATSSPAGVPGCPVTSPFSCIAVRRGQAVTFESSEALNACPKLRGRTGGPCSAVCVPVGFMGRALGVLHTTGPDGRPPTPDETAQLTILAGQAGARIGTLRAFEKTQLQAATDGLTGLLNRRTFESRVRGLIAGGRLFALVVTDLDHFKNLNDTYGHEAGDAALRLFAHVAREALREQDVIARWGGEEFALVLPEIDSGMAVPILERLRERLAHAHTGGRPAFTASFGVTDSMAGSGLERLMAIADAGLYAAKRSGRDRIAIGDAAAGEAPVTAPQAEVVEQQSRPDALAPMLHEVASEPEPRATGLEIR
jgi:diguanylate cyclase (GGDEF)-like protein/PAS domain S-box-containing protein